MVRLRLADNKVQRMNFEAVYLPDNQHFTFILIGSKIMTKANLVSGLYDDLTGLPNFICWKTACRWRSTPKTTKISARRKT